MVLLTARERSPNAFTNKSWQLSTSYLTQWDKLSIQTNDVSLLPDSVRQTQHSDQWCLPLTWFSETNSASRPMMSPSYLIQQDKLSIQTNDVSLSPDSVRQTQHSDHWCHPFTQFSETNSASWPRISLSYLIQWDTRHPGQWCLPLTRFSETNSTSRPMMSPSNLIQRDKHRIQANDVSLLPYSERQIWHQHQWCLPLTWFSETNSLSLTGSIKIRTYRIWGSWVYLPYLFTNCVTRSCDLLDRFIQTWIGST